MDSRDLEYVLTVNQTKNFSKAAELLFVSQPALSQYIKRLEHKLGVELFYRNRTQVLLTPAGQLYVNHAAAILQQVHALEQAMTSFRKEKKQEISFGVSQFYGKYLLTPLIDIIHTLHPRYKVNIVDGESRFLEDQIMAQKLNFGIFPAPTYNKQVEFMPIYQEKIFFAFSRHNTQAVHLLKTAWNGTYIDLYQYQQFPFIMLRKGLKLQDLSKKLCQTFGFQPQAVYQSENLDTVYSLVNNNYGVSFLPSTMLHHMDTSKNNVLFYPIKSKFALRTIGLVYLRGLHEKKILQTITQAFSVEMNKREQLVCMEQHMQHP